MHEECSGGGGGGRGSAVGLTVDRAGNVVVADTLNNALRTVTRAGAVVSTLAGNGEAGSLTGRARTRASTGHTA
jgi:hypothetical protein